jgi:UDP-GlcNAc3NAcA epimerase
MAKIRVLTVVGARPQFIKAAVVSRAMRTQAQIEELILHTGQHYDHDMSEVFFDELAIPHPAYNLAVGSGSHGAQTGAMLAKIEEVILAEKPDWVLIYGDTNSTLAAALAASKLHVPVAHVEAGLRSFNKRMPEEQNRIVADHLSSLLLTPTVAANENLAREGIDEGKIQQVGDVMYDATLYAGQREQSGPSVLEKLGLEADSFILSTIHRAENTDVPARMEAVLSGLAEAAESHTVLLPLHPRTKKLILENERLKGFASKLKIVAPVGYFEMASLEAQAALIVTDSGGVQKEAYFHQKPCVTLRDETEWNELVDLGWNRIQPPTSQKAVAGAVKAALGTTGDTGAAPFGNGKAGEQIVEILTTFQP